MQEHTSVPHRFIDLVDQKSTKGDFEHLVSRHIPPKFQRMLCCEAKDKLIQVLMCSSAFAPAPASFDFSAFGAVSGARNDSEHKLFIDAALALGTIEASPQSGRYQVPVEVHDKLKAIFERHYP